MCMHAHMRDCTHMTASVHLYIHTRMHNVHGSMDYKFAIYSSLISSHVASLGAKSPLCQTIKPPQNFRPELKISEFPTQKTVNNLLKIQSCVEIVPFSARTEL